MLDQLQSMLRQRFEPPDSEEIPTSGPNEDIATVTPFTPDPPAPKIGDMSDRAEAAIDELAETLKEWFVSDLHTLFDAWDRYETAQTDSGSLKDVFHASHNLSGMAETYGQPDIGRVCRSLCKLINAGMTRKRMALARLHIDSCRAIQTSGDSADKTDAICLALEMEVEKLSAGA